MRVLELDQLRARLEDLRRRRGLAPSRECAKGERRPAFATFDPDALPAPWMSDEDVAAGLDCAP